MSTKRQCNDNSALPHPLSPTYEEQLTAESTRELAHPFIHACIHNGVVAVRTTRGERQRVILVPVYDWIHSVVVVVRLVLW